MIAESSLGNFLREEDLTDNEMSLALTAMGLVNRVVALRWEKRQRQDEESCQLFGCGQYDPCDQNDQGPGLHPFAGPDTVA